MKVWDVAVVGAGPAGGAAALEAARVGASVVILERSSMPRYKRCGGGVVGVADRELRRLGVDIDLIRRDIVSRVTFTLDGRRAFTRHAQPFLAMASRAELDAAIVATAVAAGAELRTRTTVTGYDQQSGNVTLTTSSGHLVARRVVAADGSQGRAAAYVGVRHDQVDLGLEAEFPNSEPNRWLGHVLLDWGMVPGSYGWVFPKGDSLTVGVIGDRRHGSAAKRYFAHFLASLDLSVSCAAQVGGHLTRVRADDSPLRRGNVLVAGDAAGLLEPWTREGISFALRSGAIAGRAAVGDPSMYRAAVQAELGPEIAAGRSALQLFRRSPGLVHYGLRCAPGAWKFFVDYATGRIRLADEVRRPAFRAAARFAS